MAPRSYRLGKRAASQALTRARIVDAAATLYERQGIQATSMQDVAREAGVSPATVLNHFARPDRLARAVVAHLAASLRMPTPDALADATTLEARVETLAREIAAFYERSERWYGLYMRERGASRAFAAEEARFHAALERLTAEALGPLAERADVVAAFHAIASPPVFGQLRATGMSADDAGRLVAEILSPWLARQASTKRGASPSRRRTRR